MILVTGDVVLDHNIYAGQRFTSDSDATPGMLHRRQPGGALLTYGLLQALGRAAVSSAKGKGPSSAVDLAFGFKETKEKALQNWPLAFQSGAVWEAVGPNKGKYPLDGSM